MLLQDSCLKNNDKHYNMKLSLYFIIMAFVFASCSPSVRFGMSQKYGLNKGEQAVKLDNDIIGIYENTINIDSLNYPLNKCVASKKYKIFIGVSFQNKANEIANFYQNSTAYSVFKTDNTKNNVSLLFNKDSAFLYSYIYDSPKDKLTYFLTLEADSATSNKMYKNDYLKNRLK